jgi:hypothetical protein
MVVLSWMHVSDPALIQSNISNIYHTREPYTYSLHCCCQNVVLMLSLNAKCVHALAPCVHCHSAVVGQPQQPSLVAGYYQKLPKKGNSLFKTIIQIFARYTSLLFYT